MHSVGEMMSLALVQTSNSDRFWAFAGEDETMKKIPSLEKLFKGRHFEREIIVLLCALVPVLQV
jgi:hypothetical protein